MDDVYAPNYNPPESSSGINPAEEKKGVFGRLRSNFVDFLQTLVVFGAIFAIIYLFVAQPHKVSGQSMFPNFHNGDYILTDKISYRFYPPKYGDVIVLRNPRNESQDFIKRIIALPGQTIKVENTSVYVNGLKLDERYLPSGTPTRGGSFLRDGEIVTVPEDQWVVIGDNREHSSDSREIGPIPQKQIIGRVFFRYFPLNALGLIPYNF